MESSPSWNLHPVTTDLLHIVGSWKQDEFVEAQAAILHIALARHRIYPSEFYPGDIPESVSADSRQGVASNAWTSLRALDIIDRIPITTTRPDCEIYGGRKRNTNPHAKSRWCAVYYLKSRPLAEAWLRRHGFDIAAQPEPKQAEMALT